MPTGKGHCKDSHFKTHMKIAKLILFGTLVLNIVLFVHFVTRPLDREPMDPSTRTEAPIAGAGGGARVGPSHQSSASLYNTLYSRDPALFAENLRSAGFPMSAVRGAVYALLRDIQSQDRERIAEMVPVQPFWNTSRATNAFLGVQTAEILKLQYEREKAMRTLFEEDRVNFRLEQQFKYGILDDKKLEALTALDYEIREKRVAITNSGRMLMPWDSEHISALEAQRLTMASGLLNEVEFLQYRMRSSERPQSIISQLIGVSVTEEEFRTIVAADSVVTNSMDRDSKIKTLLGEDRWQQYYLARDPEYRHVFSVVRDLSLPVSNVATAYSLLGQYKTKVADLRARGVSGPALQRELKGLHEESQRHLTPLLTDDGLKRFEKASGRARIFD
jgi:hypothetical protein